MQQEQNLEEAQLPCSRYSVFKCIILLYRSTYYMYRTVHKNKFDERKKTAAISASTSLRGHHQPGEPYCTTRRESTYSAYLRGVLIPGGGCVLSPPACLFVSVLPRMYFFCSFPDDGSTSQRLPHSEEVVSSIVQHRTKTRRNANDARWWCRWRARPPAAAVVVRDGGAMEALSAGGRDPG